MGNRSPALEAYLLTRSRHTVGGESVVWRSPDIVVQGGEFVALLSRDPSDTQLVMGMVSGLLEPTGGVVRIDGKSVEDLGRPERARWRSGRLGMLFRVPRLVPEWTVLKNVLAPLSIRAKVTRPDRERALQLLERLKIRQLADRKPATLTTLEGQQVALARSLIGQPALILADEPSAGLAHDEAELFIRQMLDICHDLGVAVLLGTSDPAWATLADRTVAIAEHGGREFAGPQEKLATQDLLSDIYDTDLAPMLRPVAPVLDLAVKPLLYTAFVAVVIVFLTFFSLRMAGAGRSNLNVDVFRGAADAFKDSAEYLGRLLHGELGSYPPEARYYYWSQPDKQVADEVARTMPRSLVLLGLSMVLGALIGVPLGLGAAVVRHRRYSLVFLVLAIVGISTPSFFLAMLLQILEINFYRRAGFALVPVGGFGWDRHIVLPALVLAARPIAQVARVSFVSLARILDADYVRTARAKGLIEREVISRHALRNAGVSILTALGTSMRFSLSSLPVVEAIFQWGGMGALLLDAVRSGNANLAATLTLILGVLFVLIQVLLDFLYRWVDPRIREDKSGVRTARSWVDMISSGWGSLSSVFGRLAADLNQRSGHSRGHPGTPERSQRPRETISDEQLKRDAKIHQERRRAWVQSTAGSLPFMLGAIIILGLLMMALFGQRLAPYSPFSPVASYTNETGELVFPPFAPSSQFPLGTDAIGRDIWTLLLYGARRTLALAFFAVVARVLLGTVLGALSGWFPDSLLDRALMGLNQVIAAFPSLLLAMVLIYAFGIRQGLWVFALALCMTGWGEVAQSVRGYVMSIREQDYVEGALAVGLGDMQLLARHVLPNLVPSLVVLACLEMGGVLMTLGELGFIGVFIGGGWSMATATDSVATYFDVPEWGVMLSSSWRTFRSQPWMTFYPALAFSLAILGFNLFGEGLRRLTERLTLTMHRIINRYTIGAAVGLGALMLLAAEGTGSWAQFTASASLFDATRSLADARALTSPEMAGRAIGTEGFEAAGDYIARQFDKLELQPAGAEVQGALTYFSESGLEFRSLEKVPSLELLDKSGAALLPLAYRRDYAEMPDGTATRENYRGEVICVGIHPNSPVWPETMEVSMAEAKNAVLLVLSGGLPSAASNLALQGVVLSVVEDDEYITHRQLPARSLLMGPWLNPTSTPVFYITTEVATAILEHAGYGLDEILQRQRSLQPGQGFAVRTGVDAAVDIAVGPVQTVRARNVQAFIPGSDNSLDNELVMVIASYDGLGDDLDGTPYPGANRNASGVAVMLEVARLLKEADYQPRRTVMFVAWAGSERHSAPDFWGMLRERPGFLEQYRIVAAIDLVAVGNGATDTLLLERSSSGRLTEALQEAARRVGVAASTLGSGPYGVYARLYPAPEKKIPYLSVTWSGSGIGLQTPEDTVDNLSTDKLEKAGRIVALATMYLGHERDY